MQLLELVVPPFVIESDSGVVPVFKVCVVVHPENTVIIWLEVHLLFVVCSPVRIVIPPWSGVVLTVPWVPQFSEGVGNDSIGIFKFCYIEEAVGMTSNQAVDSTVSAATRGHWVVFFSEILVNWI